jgi:S1-C subfamily serine protease
VKLQVRRGTEDLDLTLTPRPKGRIEGEDLECKAWNMTVKAINEFATPTLYFYVKKGVYVQGIRQPGNAADSGLRRGDVILSIEGKEIQTLEDMRRAFESLVGDEKRERKARMVVFRNGLRLQLVLDFSTKYKE